MLLSLKNVDYYYGKDTVYEVQALKQVSADFAENEFVGLIGHTGSGKSTFLQLLNGLEKPYSGEVLFHGKNIWDRDFNRKQLRAGVGLVFQYPEHQLFEADVISDVCFGPKNFGLSEEGARNRALWALDLVGLEKRFHQSSPFELSGGQKRRAAIAGVIASKPEVLVMDEPTAGLDPKGKKEILDMLSALRRQEKCTIILVSHSMEEVAEYVDRIMVFDAGSIVFDDQKEKVFSHIEELESIQLAAPQVCYILRALKEKGFAVDTGAITLEAAKETILEAVKNRSHA